MFKPRKRWHYRLCHGRDLLRVRTTSRIPTRPGQARRPPPPARALCQASWRHRVHRAAVASGMSVWNSLSALSNSNVDDCGRSEVTPSHFFILWPRSLFRTLWGCLILAMIAYICTVVPLRVCFRMHTEVRSCPSVHLCPAPCTSFLPTGPWLPGKKELRLRQLPTKRAGWRCPLQSAFCLLFFGEVFFIVWSRPELEKFFGMPRPPLPLTKIPFDWEGMKLTQRRMFGGCFGQTLGGPTAKPHNTSFKHRPALVTRLVLPFVPKKKSRTLRWNTALGCTQFQNQNCFLLSPEAQLLPPRYPQPLSGGIVRCAEP